MIIIMNLNKQHIDKMIPPIYLYISSTQSSSPITEHLNPDLKLKNIININLKNNPQLTTTYLPEIEPFESHNRLIIKFKHYHTYAVSNTKTSYKFEMIDKFQTFTGLKKQIIKLLYFHNPTFLNKESYYIINLFTYPLDPNPIFENLNKNQLNYFYKLTKNNSLYTLCKKFLFDIPEELILDYRKSIGNISIKVLLSEKPEINFNIEPYHIKQIYFNIKSIENNIINYNSSLLMDFEYVITSLVTIFANKMPLNINTDYYLYLSLYDILDPYQTDEKNALFSELIISTYTTIFFPLLSILFYDVPINPDF